MCPVIDSETVSKPGDIKNLLRPEIENWLKSPSFNNQKIIRFERRIKVPNIALWVSHQKFCKKFYWSDRENTFEMGGIGIADEITAKTEKSLGSLFEYFSENLPNEHSDLRYYGGFCFNHNNCDDAWEQFGSHHFWLPRFEILQKKNETVFACNLTEKDRTATDTILNDFHLIEFENLGQNNDIFAPKKRIDCTKKDAWIDSANTVLDGLQKALVQKVVLARKTVFEFDNPIEPYRLLENIKKLSPNCYHFCFQINESTAFLGASPERLYQKEGEKILTEALAGTRPRGETTKEDGRLKEELLNSKKDHHEHQLVIDCIEKNISPLCTQLLKDAGITLLKLNSGHHLLTQFKGALKPGVSNQDILESLHPTPAVAGCPKQKALAAIAELEPFSRGWYAGPIGYVGSHKTEFAVAIRSGLIENNRLALFSGAGIVKGSKAADEWQEVENKITIYLAAFQSTAKT